MYGVGAETNAVLYNSIRGKDYQIDRALERDNQLPLADAMAMWSYVGPRHTSIQKPVRGVTQLSMEVEVRPFSWRHTGTWQKLYYCVRRYDVHANLFRSECDPILTWRGGGCHSPRGDRGLSASRRSALVHSCSGLIRSCSAVHAIQRLSVQLPRRPDLQPSFCGRTARSRTIAGRPNGRRPGRQLRRAPILARWTPRNTEQRNNAFACLRFPACRNPSEPAVNRRFDTRGLRRIYPSLASSQTRKAHSIWLRTNRSLSRPHEELGKSLRCRLAPGLGAIVPDVLIFLLVRYSGEW